VLDLYLPKIAFFMIALVGISGAIDQGRTVHQRLMISFLSSLNLALTNSFLMGLILIEGSVRLHLSSEKILSISPINVSFFLFQVTSMITSSPQCCRAQRRQVVGRLGSSQGLCTPQVAVVGESSLTTTWSVRTAPSPPPQLSQTVAALSWKDAPSMTSSSLMAALDGDPTSDVHAKEAANQTAARASAWQTAALPKGKPKGATCVVTVASLMPRLPI